MRAGVHDALLAYSFGAGTPVRLSAPPCQPQQAFRRCPAKATMLDTSSKQDPLPVMSVIQLLWIATLKF